MAMEKITKFYLSMKLFLQLLRSFPPNPQSSPSPPTSDPEISVAADDQQHHQHQPADEIPNRSGVVVVAHNDVEWPAKVIAFCFSFAVSIALQSLQIHRPPLPISFQLLSHAIVIAVTLLYLSKYMYLNNPKLAQVLEHVGVLFGVTAFFVAITIPFPLWLKLTYWTIYALSLLAIAFSYFYRKQASSTVVP